MAIPSFVDRRIVQTEARDATGEPMAMRITFRPTTTRGGGGVTIYEATREATNILATEEDGTYSLDPNGLVSINLVCGDDTDLTPFTGYHVTMIPVDDETAEPEEFDITVPTGTEPLNLDEARTYVDIETPPLNYIPRREELTFAGIKTIAFTGNYLDLTNRPVNEGWLRFYDQSVVGGWDVRGELQGPRSWRAILDVSAPIPTEMTPGDDLWRRLPGVGEGAPEIVALDIMNVDLTLTRVNAVALSTIPVLKNVRVVNGPTILRSTDRTVRVDSEFPTPITIPHTDTDTLVFGESYQIRQVNTGQAYLLAASGVNLYGHIHSAGPDTSLWVTKVETNGYDIAGGVTGPAQMGLDLATATLTAFDADFAATAPVGVTGSDNFTRPDAVSLGGSWNQFTSGAGIVGNHWAPVGANSPVSRFIISPTTSENFSEVVFAATDPGISLLAGPCVQMPVLTGTSLSGTGSFYLFSGANAGITAVAIRRKDAGATTFTTMGGNATAMLAVGDIMRLETVGTELIGYINGDEVIRRDKSLAPLADPTQRGVGVYSTINTAIRLGNWSGGDL